MSRTSNRSTRRPPDSLARFWSMREEGQLAGHYYVWLLGLHTTDTAGLLEKVRAGFSFAALERFQRNTALPTDDLAELVQITLRTLSRRKEEGRLHADESDRLLRASRVFVKALELFEGDADAAREWFLGRNTALGGATPLSYSSTEVGALEVEALIGRLEHGIPS